MLKKAKNFFTKIANSKKYSAELRLISTGTLLIIVFLAFFNINGTLGWFSSNNEVSSTGMNVSVKNLSDFTVSLSSYAVPHIEGLNYEVSTETSNILPTLDPSGIVYNPNEKALVVMITIESSTDTRVNLILSSRTSGVSYEMNNYFSNCIKITPATLGGTSPKIATREGDASSLSFVTPTDGGLSKVDSIPLASSIEMRANEEITLCFVIEYYEMAVSSLFGAAFGAGEEIHEMFFYNDLDFLIERAE